MEMDFGRKESSDFEDNSKVILPSLDRLTIQVMRQFEALSEIPRKSGYTKEIVKYLEDFADSHNLHHDGNDYKFERNYETYHGRNVWIDLEATKGCEGYPPVILQAHSDMVAEVDEGYIHDHTKDPIEVVYDGNDVRAKHTTLGADNGIGMALMLAIAESDEPHGPIRLLFTGDEEWSCQGASHLRADALNAGILINLDSEDIDQICYSSAGGVGISMTKHYKEQPIKDDEVVVKMALSGLQGGHSGININDQSRMHSTISMMEVVKELQENGIETRFAELKFGENPNSIPRSGCAYLAIPKDKLQEATKIFDDLIARKRKQYEKEINLVASFAVEEKKTSAISAADTRQITEMFFKLRQGVYDMVKDNRGLVETSSYAGRMLMAGGSLDIGVCSRSFVDDRLGELDRAHKELSQQYSMTYKSESYSAWFADPNSDTVQLIAEAYDKAKTGIVPQIVAIHAGLECSRFVSLREGMQMVSLGPTLRGVHSTKETLDLSTVRPCAEVLNYFLRNVHRIKTAK